MSNRNNNPLSVAGLFVGCGGLDYGFQQAGFNMVWANEFSPDASKSYTDLVGHDVVVDDIWDVINEVPTADVLIGGPPVNRSHWSENVWKKTLAENLFLPMRM